MVVSPSGGVRVGPLRSRLERHFKHAALGGELRSSSVAICAALTGLLCALGVEPGAPALVGLAALGPLTLAASRARPRQAALAGWAAGALFTLVSHRFLPGAIAGPLGLGAGGAWSALAVFALYRGVPWGLAALVGSLLTSRGRRGALATAVTFTGLELLWPALLPFPLGASLAGQLELLQIADLLGPSGTTLIATTCAAALAEAASRRDRATLALGGLGLAACFTYGALRVAALERELASSEALTARLLQPAHARGEAGALFGDYSAVAPDGAAAADLTVWPESALPRALPAQDAAPLAAALFGSASGPVLAGALESRAGQLSNVALLFSPEGGPPGRYEKRELVPIAEPTAGSWLGAWLAASPHREGQEQPPLAARGQPLAVTICYEALLSSYVRQQVVSTGGRAIVNLANDGWFRGASEPELHLVSSRLRAIETRRSVLRAANDGITAAIDPAGREIARLPGRAPGALSVTVPLCDARSVYLRWGVWPIALLLCALGAVACGRRSGQPAPPLRSSGPS